MTVSWNTTQPAPISWEEFLGLGVELRRESELVDGYLVPREQRSRNHQKVGARVSNALERAAVVEMRRDGGGSCYETNTEVDVLLWEVPPTARKPDAVVHRCLPDYEQLTAAHCLIVVEVLSTWSARRDRVHKMSDYADAGIPHYWLVSFDKVGALTIERYALSGAAGPYTHIGTVHRDMGPVAVDVSDPFPIELVWRDLEIAPPD
ncbi:Uma2 family endonuclease [Nocardia sp. NPDC059180]|uniref:Uma2 family endonuclease n=1 Tax=Nocardia sp. NPDC059180 TaxID=3346761 RepID=UPI00368A4FDC